MAIQPEWVPIQIPNTERIDKTNRFVLDPVPRQKIIDIWSTSLKFNLIYAKIAMDYSDRVITKSTTFPGRNGLRVKEADLLSTRIKIAKQRGVKDTPTQNLRERILKLGGSGFGNCLEMAEVATLLLESTGIRAESYCIQNGDHIFTVMAVQQIQTHKNLEVGI